MTDAEQIAEKVRESLDYIDKLPDPAVRDVVRRCYGWAARDSFCAMIVFASGALLGAFLIRERRL